MPGCHTGCVVCTHTHTHIKHFLLTFPPLKSIAHRKTRKGFADSSGDNSRVTPRVRVFLQLHVSVCMCVCLRKREGASASVCLCACVRCASQNCQHIASQREPYRNRDICGVKGRQLARPSPEEAEERRKEEERRPLTSNNTYTGAKRKGKVLEMYGATFLENAAAMQEITDFLRNNLDFLHIGTTHRFSDWMEIFC